MEAFAQFVPLILIFAIMYFLLIRPQQRKLKDHKKMVESLLHYQLSVLINFDKYCSWLKESPKIIHCLGRYNVQE